MAGGETHVWISYGKFKFNREKEKKSESCDMTLPVEAGYS